MKKFISVILLFFFLANPAFAGSSGTSIFSFLKVNPSARDSALGGMSSLSSDVYAMSNFANIASKTGQELFLSHMLYLQDSNETTISYVYPKTDRLVFAGHVGYVGVGG